MTKFDKGMAFVCLALPLAFLVYLLLSSCGCAGVATVARPAPMPGTLSPDTYGEAETAFAGVDGEADAAPGWTVGACQRLLNQRDALVWVTAFAGALGGAGGLGTAFPEDDNRNVRLGLGLSTAILAAVSTSTALIARSKSNEFEHYCNQSKDPVTE